MYDLAGAVWRKSSRSNANNNCVEIAAGRPGFDEVVAVRDGKDPDGPVLIFQVDGWTAFLIGTRAGTFDLNH